MSKSKIQQLRKKMLKQETVLRKAQTVLDLTSYNYNNAILKQYKKNGKIQEGDFVKILGLTEAKMGQLRYPISSNETYKVDRVLSSSGKIKLYLNVGQWPSGIDRYLIVGCNNVVKVDKNEHS